LDFIFTGNWGSSPLDAPGGGIPPIVTPPPFPTVNQGQPQQAQQSQAQGFVSTQSGVNWLDLLFGPACGGGIQNNLCVTSNGPFPSITGCVTKQGGAVPCTDPAAATDCDNAGGETQPSAACVQAYVPVANLSRKATPERGAPNTVKTYLTHYLPCVGAGWIKYTVGDKEHAYLFFGSNVALPMTLAPTGPKGVVTGITTAAAYDFNAAANIDDSCTQETYGPQQ
jgi:hypothetical protein